MPADPQRADEARVLLEGRLRFSPVLGHVQRGGRWVARLANTVEDDAGSLVTVEFRGDRAEVAERALSVGCRVRASGRWSGRRFDVDRFDVEAEDLSRGRRYRLTSGYEVDANPGERAAHRPGRSPDPRTGAGERETSPWSDTAVEPPTRARARTSRSTTTEAGPAEAGDPVGEGRPVPGLHGRRVDGDGVLRI